MMTQEPTSRGIQLQSLCDEVRKYAKARDYQKCVAMICEAMGKFPNAPLPYFPVLPKLHAVLRRLGLCADDGDAGFRKALHGSVQRGGAPGQADAEPETDCPDHF